MKMVKSLLLGSAAGLVAMAGAQAADLPVKAKPVQYVKICSLYGAGFYYIPGTDTCLKVGGWVRTEYNIGAGGSFNPIVNGANAAHTRVSTENNFRSRGVATFDARAQTAYGTLRSYISMGFNVTNGPGSTTGYAAYSTRAFIQIAGFTLGLATSFFDFYVTPAYSNTTNVLGSDTGGAGINVWAYTAQLGNGLSASISLEDAGFRRAGIWNTGTTALATTGLYTSSYAGVQWPDVVANLRVDQSWGSAQIMGAIHDVSATYYGGTAGTGGPDSKIGWAVGAGLKFNLPMLGAGDNISAQVTYAKGALNYVGSGLAGFGWYDGGTVGFGVVSDAVYTGAAGSSLELTEAWSVVAGYQHAWSPSLKTTLYGAYGSIDYNSTAAAAILTSTGLTGSPDFKYWQIGTRTTWTPVANLDLSVDVMYHKFETGFTGATGVIAPPGGGTAASYTLADQDAFIGILRAQRNFYP